MSSEAGPPNVFIRPFPDDGSGAVWQISPNGGIEPVWSHSGRELFYKAPQEGLVAARLRFSTGVAVEERRPLFNPQNYLNSGYHQRYAVLPGDTGFVMIRMGEGSRERRVQVVLDWF